MYVLQLCSELQDFVSVPGAELRLEMRRGIGAKLYRLNHEARPGDRTPGSESI
jgi:hypothetical protein